MKSRRWIVLLLLAISMGPSAWAGEDVSALRPGTGAHHFAAPGGKPTADGTEANPWDLETALKNTKSIAPGDTLWLRGGSYRGNGWFKCELKGTEQQPIMIAPYPGEQARLEGKLEVSSQDTWFWDLEVFNPHPARVSSIQVSWTPDDLQGGGVVLIGGDQAPALRNRLIHLIIHDNNASGVEMWRTAPQSQVYGCLIYYNGWSGPDRPHGHGIYTQNEPDKGTMVIKNNFIFKQAMEGFQAYGSGNFTNNYDIVGNIFFWNGEFGASCRQSLVLGSGAPGDSIRVIGNCFFGRDYAQLGYAWGADHNKKIVFSDNVLGCGMDVYVWKEIEAKGNIFFYDINYVKPVNPPPFEGARINMNLNKRIERPTETLSVVIPDEYEPGRANVAVYNWARADIVSVDVSKVLSKGDRFEVRNAEDYFAAPVAEGVFTGEWIKIPMNNLTVAKPNGNLPWKPKAAGPDFGAFVLRRAP